MAIRIATHSGAKASTRDLCDRDGKAISVGLQIRLVNACSELALNLARQELPDFGNLPAACEPENLRHGTAVRFIESLAAIDAEKNWWVFIANMSEFSPVFDLNDWAGLFVHRGDDIVFIGVYERRTVHGLGGRLAAMSDQDWTAFLGC